jgi:hypothetical protein
MRNSKPIVGTFYTDAIPRKIKQELDAMGTVYTVRNIFSTFHGIEVTAKPYRGKGSTTLNNKLWELLVP